MNHRSSYFNMVRLMLFAAVLTAALATITMLPADARGGHGRGGHGMHGSQLAGDRRHGNDTYIKAASDDRDKLLDTKLKSICRGC
jgi:hypothetical protein